jgi:hypothetical protein
MYASSTTLPVEDKNRGMHCGRRRQQILDGDNCANGSLSLIVSQVLASSGCKFLRVRKQGMEAADVAIDDV